MKKTLVCTLLGILVGFSLGNSNSVEKNNINVEHSANFETTYTFIEKFVEEDGNCFMCCEKLYESEKMVCIYCRSFLDGYAKGVEKTIEKYGIVEEAL